MTKENLYVSVEEIKKRIEVMKKEIGNDLTETNTCISPRLTQEL